MSCGTCNGLFFVVDVDGEGNRSAVRCPCFEGEKESRYLAAAKIPEGFRDAELDNFDTHHTSCSNSQKLALLMANRFASKSIPELASKGVIFYGRCGVGKTHLAMGLFKKLMRDQRRSGLFQSSTHLVELIRSTFDRDDVSKWEVLSPVLGRDILLLDDLGAGKISEFVQEELAYVLMERYNRKLTTIITTNYPVKPPRDEKEQGNRSGRTLGDCIGERAYSRLLEMCITIPIHGEDFRQTVKQAHNSIA